MRRLVGVGLAVLLASACTGGGTSSVLVEGHVPWPYPGRLDLPLGDADSPSFLEQTGSASKALECDSAPLTGQRGYFGPNLEAVQGSATEVLERFLQRSGAGVPRSGYRVEKRAQHRVLLSYDVHDRTKVAVVAVDGVEDSTHHKGWALEAWAMCDPADLPESVSGQLGYQVWEDASGRRVPTTVVRSFPGGAHCDWQDVTFLEHHGRSFVRDPKGKLTAFLRGSLDLHAALPPSAQDTGLRRDGRALWEQPDGQAVYLVRGDEVERWPGASRPITCA